MSHGNDLQLEVEDKVWAQTITHDGWQAVVLNDRQRAICMFAEKLTKTPALMGDEDTDALRGVGLEDADILDVVQAASYFNYINRVADAIGVPPEADWK
ncbi:MAG: putative peroxidase-related enzyme [Planctomycetota bacterium]|jgi:uncharacterized peroxidase-related enzyme